MTPHASDNLESIRHDIASHRTVFDQSVKQPKDSMHFNRICLGDTTQGPLVRHENGTTQLRMKQYRAIGDLQDRIRALQRSDGGHFFG